jgi:uncharacterized protein (TIGR02271 family)
MVNERPSPSPGEHGATDYDESWPDASAPHSSRELPTEGQTLQLRREELVATKEMRHVGDVEIRTEIEHIPGRLEVEALREDVEVEHVPVGRVVAQREAPREENDVLIVPVYEEQLVVTKRLVLREELRVRRVPSTETCLFEEDLRRERLVIEDLAGEGLIYEHYPSEDAEDEPHENFFENLKRKMMQP